ncbi:MAG: aminotransferase class IV [Deltaproteobacteria bacterium]|nr:aminotransferase class IV [Deltaproteobacteria bacterium]
MNNDIKVWLDGTLVDWRNVQVSPLSHSFSRASAIFDVLAIIETRRGPAYFCPQEHVDRLFFSADAISMNLPYTKQQILDALDQTAKTNHISKGAAKIFAYYPDITLGTMPAGRDVSVAIYCLDYEQMGITQEKLDSPISVGISRYRKLHPDTTALHAKVVGNYVNGFLAKTEVVGKGYDEALMLDVHGNIAEGPTSNIFFVNGQTIETPSEKNVLPGITRGVIMEILSELDYPIMENSIRPEELSRFDEAFFSGTLNFVQPICRIEDTLLTCPGQITSAIKEKIHEVFHAGTSRYDRWLSYIK